MRPTYDIKKEYLNLTERLIEVEGESIRAIRENAYALSNLGDANLSLNKFDEGKQYFEQALTLFQKVSLQDKSVKWVLEIIYQYQRLSHIERSQKNLDSALSLMQTAIDIAETAQVDDPQNFQLLTRQANLLNDIGKILFIDKKFVEAKPFFEDSYAIISKLEEREPNDRIVKSLKLSSIYSLLDIALEAGNQDAAQRLQKQFDDLVQERLDNQSTEEFDIQFDVKFPELMTRQKMRTLMAAGQFEEAAELLPNYEKLLARIDNIPDLGVWKNIISVRYWSSKTVLHNDVDSLRKLIEFCTAPENIDYRDGFAFYIQVYGIYFGLPSSEFDSIEYKFDQKDFESEFFRIFTDMNPEEARKIREILEESRRK